MRDRDELFAALSKSTFRATFSLGPKSREYLRKRGLALVMKHGREFIESRLGAAVPKDDGRQTPRKGHPIFIAQHATATCCRRCLEKWHYIEYGRKLFPSEKEYVLSILGAWLQAQPLASSQRYLPGLAPDTEPL